MLELLEKTAAEHCTTSELWFQRRGEIAMCKNILRTEENVQSALDNLNAPEDENRNSLED